MYKAVLDDCQPSSGGLSPTSTEKKMAETGVQQVSTSTFKGASNQHQGIEFWVKSHWMKGSGY